MVVIFEFHAIKRVTIEIYHSFNTDHFVNEVASGKKSNTQMLHSC